MMISVSFHTAPKRKVYTFWFTDRVKAVSFYESLKDNPDTLDAQIIQLPECRNDKYVAGMQEGSCEILENWKKSK